MSTGHTWRTCKGTPPACDLAERAVDMLTGTLWKFAFAETLEMSARLHLVLDNTEQALLRSEECVRVSSSLPMPQEAYYYTHACALRGAGRVSEADDYLEKAYQLVRQVSDRIRASDLKESWLRDVRVNREIVAKWENRQAAARS